MFAIVKWFTNRLPKERNPRLKNRKLKESERLRNCRLKAFWKYVKAKEKQKIRSLWMIF